MMRLKFAGCVVVAVLAVSATAGAQTKVACVGEQTTHSAHRENDPEYPLLMAMLLDPGFVATDKMAPFGGGFVEGSGRLFAVGNFAHPQGTVLNHDLEDPKTYLKSTEYTLLVAFKPDLVVLGPFGWHDTVAGVPLSGFPADMDALIAALQATASKPRIALATPVPEGGVDKADGFTEINGYVKAAATKHQLDVIDVWTELVGKSTLYQDDFHLTLEGRQHLAGFVGDAVKTLAKTTPDPSAGGAGGTPGVAGAAGNAVSASGGTGPAAAGSGGAPPASAGSNSPATGGRADPTPPTSTAGSSSSPGLTGTTPADSSGCGCRAAPGSHGWAAALLLGALPLLRRRRVPHRKLTRGLEGGTKADVRPRQE